MKKEVMSRATVLSGMFFTVRNCNLTDLIEIQKCMPRVRADIKFV